MFWALWYVPIDMEGYRRVRGSDSAVYNPLADFDSLGEVVMPLAVAFLDLFLGLAILLSAYKGAGTVYFMSSGAALVGILVFILGMFGLLLADFYDEWQQRLGRPMDRCERFTTGHSSALLIATAVLSGYTVLAILDAQAS
jgi:hypothetical protein